MADEGGDGPLLSSDEAFAALSNEVRIDILRVLGEANEPLLFSELFERVNYEPASNFNYHLDQLVGQFVNKTEHGYELTWAGKNIVRTAIVAGIVTDDPTIEPVETSLECPLCSSPIELLYANQTMRARCTHCVGLGPAFGRTERHLIAFPFPPSGIVDRTPEDALRAAVTYVFHDLVSLQANVCPVCSGPVESVSALCEDHEYSSTDGCSSCGKYHMSIYSYSCSWCSFTFHVPAPLAVLTNPDIMAFFHENGIESRFWLWNSFIQGFSITEEVIGQDPFRLRLTVSSDGDKIHVDVDESLETLEVERE